MWALLLPESLAGNDDESPPPLGAEAAAAPQLVNEEAEDEEVEDFVAAAVFEPPKIRWIIFFLGFLVLFLLLQFCSLFLFDYLKLFLF